MAQNPTITYTIKDVNPTTIALTGNENVLVRYGSWASVKMTPKAYDGAAIDLDTCIIRHGNDIRYVTETVFDIVENNQFRLFAADSNENYCAVDATCEMVDYIKLTCRNVNNRPDGDGNLALQCYGNYFNGSFGKKSNTLQCTYRSKVSGGTWSSYKNMTVTITDNTYFAHANITGLDHDTAYDFEIHVKDSVESAYLCLYGIKSLPVFHWGENDFVFEKPVAFNQGVTSAKGKPADLTEYGEWIPRLEGATASYSTQKGWYSKSGNIVTVGFFIKAVCTPIYEYNNVSVDGLPYCPAYKSAGGGLCSGVIMRATHNFQCFVVESAHDGNGNYVGFINTRTQSCADSIAGTSLTTSASGCLYPDNQEITLSGTITYMTL